MHGYSFIVVSGMDINKYYSNTPLLHKWKFYLEHASKYIQQLTFISVEVALSRCHVDNGREWFSNVSIGQYDLSGGHVGLRPLERSRQHHRSMHQHTQNSYSQHLLL